MRARTSLVVTVIFLIFISGLPSAAAAVTPAQAAATAKLAADAKIAAAAKLANDAKIAAAAKLANDAKIAAAAKLANDAKIAAAAKLANEAKIAAAAKLANDAKIAAAAKLANEAKIAAAAKLANDAKIAAAAKLANEAKIAAAAKLANDAKIAAAAKLANEAKIAAAAKLANDAKIAAAAKLANDAKIAAAAKLANDAKIAAAAKLANDAKIAAAAKLANDAKIAAAAKLANDAKIAAAAKLANDAKIAAAAKLANDAKIAAAAKLANDAKIAAAAKLANDAKIAAAAKLANDAKIAAAAKLANDAKIAAAAKLANDAKIAAAAKLANDAKIAAAAKLANDAKIAAAAKLANDAKIAAAAKLANEAKIAAAAKLANEAKIAAAAKLANEAKIAAAAKLANDAKIAAAAKLANEAKIAAAAKLANEAKIAAAAKLANEAKIAAAAKLANEAKIAAAAKLANEAKIAAAAKLANEAKIAAAAKLANDAKIAAEWAVVAKQQATLSAPLWSAVQGPWPSVCAGTFDVMATSGTTIFIASGHFTKGCGVYRSRDGGKTWSEQNFGLPRHGAAYPAIRAIAIAPSAPNVVYLGTSDQSMSNGLVFRSFDEGENWTEATGTRTKYLLGGSRAQVSGGVLAIDVDPRNPNAVIVGVVGDGVLRTNDGGKAWTKLLSASATDPKEFYWVVRYGDLGTIWTAGVRTYEGVSCVPLISILEPTAGEQIECKGHEPIGPFYSLDGNTFKPATGTGVLWTSLAIDPQNDYRMFAGTMGWGKVIGVPILHSGTGIQESVDGGRNWNPIARAGGVDLTKVSIVGVEMDPENPDVVYASAGSDGLFRSVNGGVDWTVESWPPVPEKGALVIAIHSTAGRLWAMTTAGVYWRAWTTTPAKATPGLTDKTAQLGQMLLGSSYTVVTQGYDEYYKDGPTSETTKGGWHPGVDFRAQSGLLISSPVVGVVDSFDPQGTGYGRVAVKIDGTNDYFIFLHLSKVDVTIGQKVNIGTAIGRTGSTGAAAHLHVELRTGRSSASYYFKSKDDTGVNKNPASVVH